MEAEKDAEKNEQNESAEIEKSEQDNSISSSNDKAKDQETTPQKAFQNVPGKIDMAIDLNNINLIQGFIMSEILARPRARRWRGNSIWNSRF